MLLCLWFGLIWLLLLRIGIVVVRCDFLIAGYLVCGFLIMLVLVVCVFGLLFWGYSCCVVWASICLFADFGFGLVLLLVDGCACGWLFSICWWFVLCCMIARLCCVGPILGLGFGCGFGWWCCLV